ncbi:MAG: IS701 family transposase [Opitutaceae bacterium]
MSWLHGLLDTATRAATASPACARRLYAHMLATLVSPCRGTLTNLICLCGRAHLDWTADYRLYSRERVEPALLFAHALAEVHVQLPAEAALVTAIDDTLVRKTGTKIDGVGWKRDPLGPAFQTNLVRGQRFVQLTAAWPGPDGQARMIPVDFTHAPTPPKPGKRASAAEKKQYKEQQKQQRLNAVALARIAHLRQTLPAARKLVVAGDGSYTNATILKGLPANTVYIGRIRKDAVLHARPGPPPATGRPPAYGAQLPTPEELRTDDTIPWQAIDAFAAGKRHSFKVKTLAPPALWRKSGAACALRVVVIAPVGYRLRQGSRVLYRQPAFLVCTDPDKPLEEVVQEYLWRWGIEVNFRDEKTLIGTGEAHVRAPASNRTQPAVTVAAYALLWIAALKLIGAGQAPPHLQPPKWRRAGADRAAPALSTADLLRALRSELWATQLSPESFSHFTSPASPDTNDEKLIPSLAHAILSAA